ncbi:MAG: hypothetical protein GX552_15740 [Chloroflexi bacterium]|nr:hypothetical protein [Chloroflexota bacterium]
MLAEPVAKADVVILLLVGLVLSWITHRYLTTKAAGKSRINRGHTYVDDGRKALQEGRKFLRQALVFAIAVLIFGTIFVRILTQMMLF